MNKIESKGMFDRVDVGEITDISKFWVTIDGHLLVDKINFPPKTKFYKGQKIYNRVRTIKGKNLLDVTYSTRRLRL